MSLATTHSGDLMNHAVDSDLDVRVTKLRNRARLLRVQAFIGLLTLAVGTAAISWVFMALQRAGYQTTQDTKGREPYDYKLMESRHEAMSSRLKELSEALADSRQELLADKYGGSQKGVVAVAKGLQDRSNELATFKSEIDTRLSKDRQNMYLEIQQLRNERDRAIADGVEKRGFIRLVGDAMMRIGILILAVYLMSIVSSIVKYWLRVADHLSSIADSVELSGAAGLPIDRPILALTPHSIDFHVEDVASLRSIRDLVAGANPLAQRAEKI